jgi:hypothetical protein
VDKEPRPGVFEQLLRLPLEILLGAVALTGQIIGINRKKRQ